ncbi:hypothetical protein RUM44_011338 [Polyplax serrata]|uniref:Uncharacterized protein n=1 Tax=Polyplax serrata TaxID=468196 RepID=A0ABR1AQ07_POLSC
MENFGRFQTFGKDITNSQIPNVGHVGHLNQNYGFDYVSCSNGNQQQGLPVYCPPQVYVEYEPLCDQYDTLGFDLINPVMHLRFEYRIQVGFGLECRLKSIRPQK